MENQIVILLQQIRKELIEIQVDGSLNKEVSDKLFNLERKVGKSIAWVERELEIMMDSQAAKYEKQEAK